MSSPQLVAISHSPEDTRRLASSLACRLAPRDLICLFGDLGAGKTTFMQGLAAGLGSPEPATSPSFTLVHEHRGRLLLYHLDLYRLIPADLPEAGIEDLLRSDAVVAVEWADRLPRELRASALEIHFDFDESDQTTRRLRFHPLGSRSAAILNGLELLTHARPCH